ncbi:MAG TPA: hypothetical protein VJS92_15195, partial [Candidatus Polarisedimenticolaceae bacterium]|nr:hypothetical protein [Candidatus Polarisedimenticolaceae bacterium]
DDASLLAALALDEEAVERYVGAGPVNTDDLPFVSFGTGARSGTSGSLPILLDVFRFVVERLPRSLLVGADPGDVARIDNRLVARKHTLAGAIQLRLGAADRAAREFGRARALDPAEGD